VGGRCWQPIAQGFFKIGPFFFITEELLHCSLTEKFVINFLGACLCYKLQTSLLAMNNLQDFADSGNGKRKKQNKGG
jgi:hypothetical protein